ncbi:cache domain-containing sensor histidine kinase [Paenibacillus qinlingensis]|uniref:cache domain-containing sensor histidine kinase n=1 Tax=Paenibacillus qinlingensis TaxID=1837343 RepID=UPI0015645C26|nr:sensor histidine kinase [Paenibacillus qinlingensis]NQX60043.1 histidine kinase [Paenibacillus qinlingensis]
MAGQIKRFRSIRSKLLGAFILVVALPTLIVFYQYATNSSKLLEHEVYTANQVLVDQSVSNMNQNAEKMVKMTYMLDSQLFTTFQNKAKRWNPDQIEDMLLFIQTQRKMLSLRDILLDNFAFIGVVDFKGDVVTTLTDFHRDAVQNISSEPWYGMGIKRKGYPYWMQAYKIPTAWGYVEGVPNKDFVLVSRVLNGVGNVDDYGVVVIGMAIDKFYGSQPTNTEDSTQFLIWDGSERLNDLSGKLTISLTSEQISELNKDAKSIKKITIDHKDYLVNVAKIPQVGVSVAALLPMDQFHLQMDKSKNRSLAIILFFYIIGLSIFVYLLLRFTKPLYSLLKSIILVGKGDFKQKVPVVGNDEASVLGSNFNSMVARLDELVHNVSEEQRKKEEAHFQALQAQINPHFLFNTLNSIKLMAMLSNTNRDVSDMITALGKLMEFSMKQNTIFVTLQQEIQYLELYMMLQKIRYHDDINITTQVPDQLLDCTVLKFTLQPLVENSIIHGSRLPLHIWIEAVESGDDIQIYVRDNGKGVSPDKMQTIQNQLIQDHAKYSGIGMLNVDRRIKLHFGSQYGLEVVTPETGGMQIVITIPNRKELME